MKILVLNAGSSSHKSCLYEFGDSLPEQPLKPLWEAQVDWASQPGMAELRVKTVDIPSYETVFPSVSRFEDTLRLLQTIWSGEVPVVSQPGDIDIVGHRVVHGGRDYQESTWVNPAVKAEIAQLATLAPVHNPVNLQGIDIIEQCLGTVPQVAVFDTAFHSQMPMAAKVYPIPWQWFEQGIQRYGFHGISHQYVATRAAEILHQPLTDLRLITCHLGNGCSLAAIHQGHSIDTTMGFTPLEGLMMGCRSGSVDPGILLHLIRHHHLDAQQLDTLLNQESGLKGVSGSSGDMRQILKQAAAGDGQANLALAVYIHRLRSHIGSMLAALGGLDALVFTGGVGENAAPIRAAVCEAFGFLGLNLDLAQNMQSPCDQDIATLDSRVRVLVIHTQEDWAIAQECWRLSQSPQKAVVTTHVP
ncbi:acetate kinase [Neosynechococcus sphagnicola sy1]|uniref:Acetate kinase n=1 Tax=Neosynechococcus sphagnicola sy1 TaxID=1497020 RepID=A0A098TI68_9CYAN|nr:acetate kinase [Neosynechococcus sphagnicola]KGF71804.1 acetate kinase [Neosynechococcus sphagnicola sy1]